MYDPSIYYAYENAYELIHKNKFVKLIPFGYFDFGYDPLDTTSALNHSLIDQLVNSFIYNIYMFNSNC